MVSRSLVSVNEVNRAIERYAEGSTLKELAASLGVGVATLYDAIQRDPITAERYERAQEVSAEVEVDEMVAIADGEENPQKARNRIDTRKWRASKRKPKKYGDKLDLTVNTNVDIAGGIAEGKARAAAVSLVPVCDQLGNVVYQPSSESTTYDAKPGDNESPNAADYDIFG